MPTFQWRAHGEKLTWNSGITINNCLFNFQWGSPLTFILSVASSNSLCGGAYRSEIMSTPNDDMHTGSFWIQFRKRFPVVATMLNSCSHNKQLLDRVYSHWHTGADCSYRMASATGEQTKSEKNKTKKSDDDRDGTRISMPKSLTTEPPLLTTPSLVFYLNYKWIKW